MQVLITEEHKKWCAECKHPWEQFLNARTALIHHYRNEGNSNDYIANLINVSEDQVRNIAESTISVGYYASN